MSARLGCEPLEDRLTPAAGVLNFEQASSTLEGPYSGYLSVLIQRTGGSTGAVAVTVSVTCGTATEGADYAAGPYRANFADGSEYASLSIPIIDDARAEADETVELALSNPTGGATLGDRVTATATIVDDDVPPQVALSDRSGVKVFPNGLSDPASPTTFNPFAGFSGHPAIALEDLNKDGVPEVIAAAGVNGHIKAIDTRTGDELLSFLAYPGYMGAVRIATGDLNGDGFADIITGAGTNAHVKAFDGKTGAELFNFLAYPGYSGAVDVAAGDVNGDGYADIITGAGINAHVKAFDGRTGAVLRSFEAYSGYSGAVYVAVGDTNRDGFGDIITGSAETGHLKIFDGKTGLERLSFLSPNRPLNDLAIVNARDQDDILISGDNGVESFNGRTGERIASALARGTHGAAFVASWTKPLGPIVMPPVPAVPQGLAPVATAMPPLSVSPERAALL